VAIIGVGNVGIDLLERVSRSPYLTVALAIGRRRTADGLDRAEAMGYRISEKGAAALIENADDYDLVFDATNARGHRRHWNILQELDKTVIDLTPSLVGHPIVPALSFDFPDGVRNFTLISCGAQSSIPLVHATCQNFPTARSAHVVVTGAKSTVGGSFNYQDFDTKTASSIMQFSGVPLATAKGVLSEEEPPCQFNVMLSMDVPNIRKTVLETLIEETSERVRAYVSGYRILKPKIESDSRFTVRIEVVSSGAGLPGYAGNLDIINAAAIHLANRWSKDKIVGIAD
jgi:acetaldehyde dehydrogenase